MKTEYPDRHSPLVPLIWRGTLIGYRCDHCGRFYTPNNKPSNPGTKAHGRRVYIAAQMMRDKIRSLWK